MPYRNFVNNLKMELTISTSYELVKKYNKMAGLKSPEKPTLLSTGPLHSNAWMATPIESLAERIKDQSGYKMRPDLSDQEKDAYVGGLVAEVAAVLMLHLSEFARAETLEEQAETLALMKYDIDGAFDRMGVDPDPVTSIVHLNKLADLSTKGGHIFDLNGQEVKAEGWTEHTSLKLIAEELKRQESRYE